MLDLVAFLSITEFFKLSGLSIGLWIAFVVILVLYIAKVRSRKQKN
jgi:heme exporter protein D